MSMSKSKGLHFGRQEPGKHPLARSLSRSVSLLRTVTLGSVLILGSTAGCLFHKKQKAAVPKATRGPVRVVLLPFNIPANDTDLQWVALATPVLLAQALSAAPDLELVPMWEGAPIARDSLGASRTISLEVAAYVASRLAARWATQGEISRAKKGYSIMLDFIPAKTTTVPFRFEKETNLESMLTHFLEAADQFSRYQVLRPMKKQAAPPKEQLPWKEIAEALDREYGWFATAEPGKAGDIVNQLFQSDSQLAKLLFNPSFYPILGGQAEPKPAVSEAPVAAPPPEKPIPQKAPADAAQVERSVPGPAPPPSRMEKPQSPSPSPPARTINTVPEFSPPPLDVAFAPPAVVRTLEVGEATVPPPKTFTQRLSPSPPPAIRKVSSTANPLKAESRMLETPASFSAPTSPESARSGLESMPSQSKEPAAAKAKGYRIQVLATRSDGEAQALKTKLALAGYSPVMEQADLGDKGTWYRIRLHGFSTRESARTAGNKLVGEGMVKEFWLVPQGVQ